MTADALLEYLESLVLNNESVAIHSTLDYGITVRVNRSDHVSIHPAATLPLAIIKAMEWDKRERLEGRR